MKCHHCREELANPPICDYCHYGALPSKMTDQTTPETGLIGPPRLRPNETDEDDLRSLLVEAKLRSSSVILNWGEDTERWEADIIVGGKRYKGNQWTAYCALSEALLNAKRNLNRESLNAKL